MENQPRQNDDYRNLLRAFEDEGFKCTVEQFAELSFLIERFSSSYSFEEMLELIIPCIATDEEEQIKLHHIGLQYSQTFRIKSDNPDTENSTKSNLTINKWRWGLFLWLTLIVVSIVIFFLLETFGLPFESNPNLETGPTDPSLIPYPLLAKLVALLVGATGLIAFGRLFNRKKQIQKKKIPPYLVFPRIQQTKAQIFSHPEQFQIYEVFGEREAEYSSLTFNLAETIRATIKRAGIISIQYVEEKPSSEYIVLIDQFYPQNHYANWFKFLLESFVDLGINIQIYFYKDNPIVCWDQKGKKFIVSKLTRNRNLIFMSDVDTFFNTSSGEIHFWVESLTHTTNNLGILIPKLIPDWNYQEQILAANTPVAPATFEGLIKLVDHFESSNFVSFSRWKEQSLSNFGPNNLPYVPKDWSPEYIQEHFPQNLVDWVASCALYPVMYWELTLELGKALSQKYANVIETQSIEKLLWIPWFRTGKIPLEYREELINLLSPEKLELAKKTIVEVIDKADNLPKSSSYAFKVARLHLLTFQEELRPEKGAEAQNISSEIKELKGMIGEENWPMGTNQLVPPTKGNFGRQPVKIKANILSGLRSIFQNKRPDTLLNGIFLIVGILLWGALLAFHWLEAAIGVFENPPGSNTYVGSTWYNLTLSGFFAANFILVDRWFRKIGDLDVTTWLWRLFIIGMGGITLILIIIIANRFTASMVIYRYLSPIYFCLSLYCFVIFFLSSVFIYRRFILFPRTRRKIITWNVFYGFLFFTILQTLIDLGIYVLIGIIFISILSLYLSSNVRWIAYLNFNQKLRALGLSVLILIQCFTYSLAGTNLPEQFGLNFAIDSLRFEFIYFTLIFSFSYTGYSILSLFFNLPNTSIPDRKALEISSFNQINRANNANLSLKEILNTLLEASLIASNAQAGWIEILDVDTEVEKVLLKKRIDTHEINEIKQGFRWTERVLRDQQYFLVKNLRKNRIFKSSHSKYKCLLVVPIVLPTEGYGAVFVVNELRNSFEDVNIQQLLSFVEQASLALENTKLVEGTLLTFNHHIQRIHEAQTREEVLKILLEVSASFGNADASWVDWMGEEKMQSVINNNIETDEILFLKKAIGGMLANTKFPLAIDQIWEQIDHSEIESRFQSLLIIPIQNNDSMLGMVYFASFNRDFSKEVNIQMIESLVSHAAIAIRNMGKP